MSEFVCPPKTMILDMIIDTVIISSVQYMCTHKTTSAYNIVRIRTVISARVDVAVCCCQMTTGYEVLGTVEPSKNIGRSISIAVGYCQVTTGNELLARVLALESVAFRWPTSLKR